MVNYNLRSLRYYISYNIKKGVFVPPYNNTVSKDIDFYLDPRYIGDNIFEILKELATHLGVEYDDRDDEECKIRLEKKYYLNVFIDSENDLTSLATNRIDPEIQIFLPISTNDFLIF